MVVLDFMSENKGAYKFYCLNWGKSTGKNLGKWKISVLYQSKSLRLPKEICKTGNIREEI